MDNPLNDAAVQALKALDGMTIGPPPGLTPVPLKDQIATFIDRAPDLILGGPGKDELVQKYGPGEAEKYVKAMLGQIAGRRQRRSPVP